ncbi:MAG: glycosyltransferase [Betaproteobacteria bacterium]|nr:glycosyltransferase [Betaproteobacteria bacterium]
MNTSTQPAPLVSLAIPVFNGANFMRFAIDSALAQTYQNIEIIIVNDGSSDGGETEKIALSYGDQVRYFSKPNGGVASALNLALQESKGEYFCWLSHDDQYLPEKIAKEVEFIRTLPNSGAVVFCRHSVIDENGELLQELPPPPQFSPDTAAYQLLLFQWLHCCTILAPRSMFLELGGFREDLPTTQDYDLLMKMGLRYPFFEVPEVLLLARSHPEQGCLTLTHLSEIERFFDEHIPMLSPDYMRRCFSPREIVDAWAALGIQMRERGLVPSALAVCRQMLGCEMAQTDPAALLDAVNRITRSGNDSAKQPSVVHASDSDFASDSGAGFIKNIIKLATPPIIWNGVKRLRNRSVGDASEVQVQEKVASKQPAKLDFVKIYEQNEFNGTESRSGGGSTLYQTRIIREELPALFRELGVKRVLDVPCGDWNWMKYVDLNGIDYTGGDVVDAIVQRDILKHETASVHFECLNIITGTLPKSDLIICRDCLVHLSFADGMAALQRFRESGATWLLTTTFVDRQSNEDLYEGHIWRPLNLELAPYNLPKADSYINEGCTEGDGLFADKCLALWRLDA